MDLLSLDAFEPKHAVEHACSDAYVQWMEANYPGISRVKDLFNDWLGYAAHVSLPTMRASLSTAPSLNQWIAVFRVIIRSPLSIIVSPM
jgi:hypothetical protein